MNASHKKLKQAAFEAVDRLHSDTSVSMHQTWDDLGELREHIKVLMDAVSGCMSDGEEGME